VAKAQGQDLPAIESYLAAVPEPHRTALEHLRSVIRSAAPDAEEVMTYAMPGFRRDGVLVSYAAFKEHLSFFPMSASLLDTFDAELKGYRKSKGTIHFSPENPLPDDLVRRIVAARLAENAARKARRRA